MAAFLLLAVLSELAVARPLLAAVAAAEDNSSEEQRSYGPITLSMASMSEVFPYR